MNIHLIVVPYDSGVRGWRMGAGPETLLRSGLEDHLRARGDHVVTEFVEAPDDGPATEIRTAFALAAALRDRVRAARQAGALAVVLAGNCGSALGTVAALAEDEPLVVWMDAHGDLNTPETSRSGFLDGMALAILTGHCWAPMAAPLLPRPVAEDHVLMVGARDLDEGEEALLADSAIRLVHADAARAEMPRLLDPARAVTATAYLHIDLDVLDPSEAVANGYAVPGGLSIADVAALANEVAAGFALPAIAFTAWDPSADAGTRMPSAVITILDAVLEAVRPASG